MKTQWGSCHPQAGHIRLNTERATKPRQFLEYLLVHEMIHLLEPTPNRHFIALMDRFFPHWQTSCDELNRLPLHYDDWTY
jgi:predicted metal-dependent hydrolase